jgi:ubiquinone/menaquinone biosynthesis C-methylase UbiE
VFHPDGPTFLELLKQALSSTERGYDLLAPKFDATPFRTPDAILAPMADEVGRHGPVRDALDVMCGTGAAMAAVRAHCTERVVGVDFSAGMLGEARAHVAKAPGSAAIELVRGDVLAMSFDRAFDVAVCTGAFGHILAKDEPTLLGNIQRALRPGGRFVFPTAEPPSPKQPGFWLGHAFNAAMRVRNALIEPRFVMYYLTMLWPAVREKLERAGFDVEARRGVFDPPFEAAMLVVATRRA